MAVSSQSRLQPAADPIRSLASLAVPDGPPLRYLVVEGNPAHAREAVLRAGGTVASDLFVRIMAALSPPGSDCTVLFAADPGNEALPAGLTWEAIDGVVWTGSALNIYEDTPGAARQIALGRQVFEAGRPWYGSCWALQLAAVIAGGTVEANPLGKEIGLARKIALTEAGRAHPLHGGRPAAFDAVAIHSDIVTRPPQDCVILSGNAMAPVQSAEIRHAGGVFWGVQYHPEFDLREIACLMGRDADSLIRQGLFADHGALKAHVADLTALAADPGRGDLAWRLGIDADVLDPATRLSEIRNWITHQVLPRRIAEAGPP